jgi:hypothetical protein
MEARAWTNGLRNALYVPAELAQIRVALTTGRTAELDAELDRLSMLGSDSAAALLDYLCLRGFRAGNVDTALVAKRCGEAAERGNSFAQYVVAWRAFHRQQYQEASAWMARSATGGFIPALGDMARYIVSTPQMSELRAKAARRNLWSAIRRGHVPSLLFWLRLCKLGHYGITWRVAALMVHPMVAVSYAARVYLHPFDIRFFAHSAEDVEPILRRTHAPG